MVDNMLESNIFKNLNSKEVFSFFIEISKIPRGSGNTKEISDYIKSFAIKRNLEYYQDDFNNVIIYKNGTTCYENKDSLILQCHMDMVCDKKLGSLKNMDLEGIDLAVDGDYLYGEETSLGADNGIAVAMILSVLDDNLLNHPPIEAVFTSDEEIGLIGANNLDMSKLQGKTLINLDSEEEGVMVVSCAGGNRLDIDIPVLRESFVDFSNSNLKLLNISIKGLKGGHSGLEIDKGLANANKLSALLLKEIKDNIDEDIKLVNLSGGHLDNAIPNFGEFSILSSNPEKVKLISKKFNQEINLDYENIEDNISICVDVVNFNYSSDSCSNLDFNKLGSKDKFNYEYISNESLDKIINFIIEMPDGVQKMSSDINGLVETSLNLGIISLDQNHFNASTAIRSNSKEGKSKLNTSISLIAESYGGKTQIKGDYPGWDYDSNSYISKVISKEFELLYDEPLKLSIIHAGLECGLFVDKICGLDAVSIGPTMLDVHSYNEKVSISSVDRTYKLLLNILEKLS